MDLNYFCHVLDSEKNRHAVMYINSCEFKKKFIKDEENYKKVVAHLVFCFEKALQIAKDKFGKETIMVFLNLKKAKMKNFSAKFMKDIIHLFEHQYPDRLQNCVILNPSFIIKIIYKILYPIIDKDTRKKFVWEKNGKIKSIDIDNDFNF